MNLSVSRISNVNYTPSMKRNNLNSKQPNFEGNITSKQIKTAAVGFGLFAASVLGLASCHSDRDRKNFENDVMATPYSVENAQGILGENEVEYEEMTPGTRKTLNEWLARYQEGIDEFMKQDKQVTKVEIEDKDDPDYINSYRMIVVKGLNKAGKTVREMTIWPDEPSLTPSRIPTYSPMSGCVRWTEYKPDKTVTYTSYTYPRNDEECSIHIDYKKPVKLNGKPGYHKTEEIDARECLLRGAYKIVRYTKGKVIDECDGEKIYSKGAHVYEVFYDKAGNEFHHINWYPDEWGALREAQEAE